ncbi:MAG: hypothetical protein HY556_04475 [Euryarchaeota archaeon]|nr:hypothetical protein [Euryarchaeota archaeon]
MKIVAFLATAAIALSVFAPTTSAAGTDPNPAVSEWIDSTYKITFTNLTRLDLDITAKVHKVRVQGTDFTADSARDQYNGISNFGGLGAGATFVTKVEDSLNATFQTALAGAFPEAATRRVTETKLNLTSLTVSNSADPLNDSYQPTIDITMKAVILQKRSALGISSISDAAIDAAFAAGARFTTNVTLYADPGHNVSYVITAPAGLSWSSPSAGTLGSSNSTLSYAITNWDALSGSVQKPKLGVTLLDASAATWTKEAISTSVELAIPSFKLTGEKLPLTATVKIKIGVISVKDRFPSALPTSITLDFISADALRALKATGAVKESDLTGGEATLLSTLKDSLEGPLGADVTVTGGFSDASLDGGATAPYRDTPSVVFEANAVGGYTLAAAKDKDLTGVFSIGAKIETEFTLTSDAGRVTDYKISIPSSVEFESVTGGGSAASDGHSATWTVDNSLGADEKQVKAKMKIHDKDATKFTAQKAKLGVTVDIKDLDIDIVKAVRRDFGKLLVDVDINGELGVIVVPDEFKDKLPSGLELEYLSSDAIRILLRDGFISQSQVDELQTKLLTEAQTRVSDAIGGNAQITGGLDEKSLASSLIATKPSGDKPIIFKAHLSIEKSLNSIGGGAAAINLMTVPLDFDLPRLQDLDTTYKVILPKGISVLDSTADGGTIEKGKTADGRDFFMVSPTGDSAQTHVTMAITESIVIAKFWPVLLAAVLVLLLIIGLPIWFIFLRKKNTKGEPPAAP